MTEVGGASRIFEKGEGNRVVFFSWKLAEKGQLNAGRKCEVGETR